MQESYSQTITYLGEVDAEGSHVKAVEKGSEVLIETRHALVQNLQMHEIGLEISHAIG